MKINYQETTSDLLKRINIHDQFGGRNIDEWMLELLQLKPGMKILDAACGAGKQCISFYNALNGDCDITGGDVSELVGDGPVIGVDESATFGEFDEAIDPSSNLYLFSDGLFEIRTKGGSILEWGEFVKLLEAHHRECVVSPACLSPINRIVEAIRGLSLKPLFDDDVSIVEFAFDA